MLPELLQKVSLFHLLYQIDLDLASQHRQCRCPHCGGRLDYAGYERKPRGGPTNIPEQYLMRHSLCCCQPGCRRRSLPASCLFMGRRVYWGCVILVVMALRQNRAESISIGKLTRMFAISRKTICRWIVYFRDVFPTTARWQSLRGRVGVRVANAYLPGALLEYFVEHLGCAQKGLVVCLVFLSGEPGGSP